MHVGFVLAENEDLQGCLTVVVVEKKEKKRITDNERHCGCAL